MTEQGGIRSVFLEIDSVVAGDQAKVRHRRQIVFAGVVDDPRIGEIELRIGVVKFKDLQLPIGIQ